VTVSDGAGRRERVTEIELHRPGYESIVRYWYSVSGEIATGPVKVKALQVLALFARKPAGGAVYVIEAPVSGDSAAARAAIQRVSEALLAENRVAVEAAAHD
jgi:hypothetical protein